MASASPQFVDPSFVNLTVSPAPSPRPTRHLDILRIILNFLIALILCAILIVLIVVTRSSSTVDPRASNEGIAQLQRQSAENIARLQRESTENLTRVLQERQSYAEDQRLGRHENFLQKQREVDRTIEAQGRQQDVSLALETLRQHLQIEERRIQVLVEDRHPGRRTS